MINGAKYFDILATSLSVSHNYFDSSTKLLFWSVSSKHFKSFSKTVLSMNDFAIWFDREQRRIDGNSEHRNIKAITQRCFG